MLSVLPFHMDPLAWTYGLLFTLALVYLYFQPPTHRLKLLVARVTRLDADVWSKIAWAEQQRCEERQQRQIQQMILLVAGLLGVLSLLSLGVFSGLLGVPPQ